MLRSLYLVLAVDKFYKARRVVIELAQKHPVETLANRYTYLKDFLFWMHNDYSKYVTSINSCREMKAEYKQMKALYARLKAIRV